MQGRGETRPAGPTEHADHIRVTSKLPLMAYFMMRGLTLVKACREGSPSRFAFYYEDPHGQSAALELQFIGSECHEFDGKMKSLRDMLGRSRPDQRRSTDNGNG